MRVQVQCVLRFLQMPIEDDFLAEVAPQQPPGVAMTADGPSLGPAEQPIPFADVGNPVMAQARAAQASLAPCMGMWLLEDGATRPSWAGDLWGTLIFRNGEFQMPLPRHTYWQCLLAGRC